MHTPSVNKVDVIDKRITNFFDKCDRLRSVRKIMLCNVNSQNKYHFLIETSKFADTIASESSARVLGRNHLIMKLAPTITTIMMEKVQQIATRQVPGI